MEQWRTLDLASEGDARRLLARACGSARWIDRMIARRPFGSQPALLAVALAEWLALSKADWLEAFRHHPRIGDRDALRTRFTSGDLAEKEQAGVAGASEETLAALADANRAYEDRFGYIFIVCAAGSSAAELLNRLQARIGNDPRVEIRIAAEEQAKITAVRLGNS